MIQPQVLLGLPCYTLTPVTDSTLGNGPPKVTLLTSGKTDSHGLVGGVYKTRERIHRSMLTYDY